MAKPHWVLLETETDWLIVRHSEAGDSSSSTRVGFSAGSPVPMIAAALRDGLVSQGYDGGAVALGLRTDRFLVAQLPLKNRLLVRDRQALAYAMEEDLPVAAEDITVDHVAFRDRLLAIAVLTEPLRELVAALQALGMVISTIGPRTSWVAQQALHERNVTCADVIVASDEYCELWQFEHGLALDWSRCPADSDSVERELRLHARSDAGITRFWVGQEVRIDGVGPETGLGIPCEVAAEELAAQYAARICSGEIRPTWEFAGPAVGLHGRNAFLRGAQRLCIIAALVFCVASIGALQILAARYQRWTTELSDQQIAAFRTAFPDQRIPVGVLSRLRSEVSKLRGQSGVIDDTPTMGSATLALQEALLPIPSDLRLRLLELRLEGDKVHLVGEVRQHSDADALARALKESVWDVKPVRTEQLVDQGVSFTIDATRTTPKQEDATR